MLGFPALVRPDTTDIGLGTMNCCFSRNPLHADLLRVKVLCLLGAAHNKASGGKILSMISSVCGSSPFRRTGDDSFSSFKSGPLDTMLLISGSSRRGQAGNRGVLGLSSESSFQLFSTAWLMLS
jgi:hypothetical protein